MLRMIGYVQKGTLLMWLLAAVSRVATAATPPGTQIQASAEALYSSTDGQLMPRVTSNTATTTVDYPSEISIGAAKAMADNLFIQLNQAVVIAGTADMSGSFYIEQADRSAGIRVATDQAILEGDMVIVCGMLATVDGERQINASDVAVVSSGNPLPRTLGMAHISIGTESDNTGLLVRVWGRITSAPENGYFYLDDGSGLRDGSGNIGVKVRGQPPVNPIGKYVFVTGVAGVEIPGSLPIRAIKTRRAEDISLLSGN